MFSLFFLHNSVPLLTTQKTVSLKTQKTLKLKTQKTQSQDTKTLKLKTQKTQSQDTKDSVSRLERHKRLSVAAFGSSKRVPYNVTDRVPYNVTDTIIPEHVRVVRDLVALSTGKLAHSALLVMQMTMTCRLPSILEDSRTVRATFHPPPPPPNPATHPSSHLHPLPLPPPTPSPHLPPAAHGSLADCATGSGLDWCLRSHSIARNRREEATDEEEE